jgi:hypothetical protein
MDPGNRRQSDSLAQLAGEDEFYRVTVPPKSVKGGEEISDSTRMAQRAGGADEDTILRETQRLPTGVLIARAEARRIHTVLYDLDDTSSLDLVANEVREV